MKWTDVSFYDYVVASSMKEPVDVVKALCKIDDVNSLPWTEFSAKCKEVSELLSTDAASEGGELVKRIGKYKLIPNAGKMPAGRFIDLCHAQSSNDMITCLGLMYGGEDEDDFKEICSSINVPDAICTLSFFLKASNELLRRIKSYSEEAEAIRAGVQQAREAGWTC